MFSLFALGFVGPSSARGGRAHSAICDLQMGIAFSLILFSRELGSDVFRVMNLELRMTNWRWVAGKIGGRIERVHGFAVKRLLICS